MDANREKYQQRLAEAVAIPSVSTWKRTRPQCIEMMHWFKKNLESLGAEAKLVEIDFKQTFPDGEQVDIPPLLIGSIGSGSKTLLIYGHLDVQPADKVGKINKLEFFFFFFFNQNSTQQADGWDTEPFTLTDLGDRLMGRGATDDKGPAISWLNMLEAYKETNETLPLKIKFIFEGMEESGSVGMTETLAKPEITQWLSDVDAVCVSDNYWLTPLKPCLTYGLRGVAYFCVTVECSKRDLHSGIYGGAVHEAMIDLVALLDSLVDSNGNILVPDISKNVLPVTEEENQIYDEIEFNKVSIYFVCQKAFFIFNFYRNHLLGMKLELQLFYMKQNNKF